MSTFDEEWKKATTLVIQGTSEVVRAAAIQVFKAIVMATPVGQPQIWKSHKAPEKYVGGTLRASWRCTVGSPSAEVPMEADKAASAALGSIASEVATFNGNGALYLTNNQPYAMRVEYGWSTQMPDGMVRINIQLFNDAISKAAKDKGLSSA